MASFTIRSYDHERVTISVIRISEGDTIRVFIRLANDSSNTTVDENYIAGGSADTLNIYGLSPETDYLINVKINEDDWLGAQAFTTTAAPQTYIIYLDAQGGSGGDASVSVYANTSLPDIEPPTKSGYVFKGYFTETGGNGVQYYDEYGEGTRTYDGSWASITIYAYWQEVGTVFSWTYEKVKDEPFNLTADEWNGLCDFVNSKRSRAYSFTAAVKDYPFTAAMYNEMVEAIGAGTEVEKGDTITADLMNELVTNANDM